MTFEEIVDQALAMLHRRGRMAYRTLKRQFDLDEEALEDLKAELIEAQRAAADEDGKVLVWTGSAASPPTRAPAHLHTVLSRRENPHLPRCPRRRAQTGYGALRRPQKFNGVAGRP
jgi:hypothetical protein